MRYRGLEQFEDRVVVGQHLIGIPAEAFKHVRPVNEEIGVGRSGVVELVNHKSPAATHRWPDARAMWAAWHLFIPEEAPYSRPWL